MVVSTSQRFFTCVFFFLFTLFSIKSSVFAQTQRQVQVQQTPEIKQEIKQEAKREAKPVAPVATTKPEIKAETKPAVSPVGTDFFYLCKRGNNTRWLRAYKLKSGECNTLYSKEGYLQVVGSGAYFASCEGVLHNVKKNLEEGGFACSPVAKYVILVLE